MKKIKIYSTSTCAYCNMLKEFLKEKNIAFENVDVGLDKEAAKEMIEKSKQMSVPVIDIEGKLIIGYNKEEIMKELGIL